MAQLRSTQTSAVKTRRRGAYLDAAESLIGDGRRFSEIQIAEIAEAAGFSRASFYAYFADKRELAVAVAERFDEQLLSGVGGWLRGEDDLTLTQAMSRTIATFEARRGAVLLLAESSVHDDELARVWRELHTEFELLVQTRLKLAGAGLSSAQRTAMAYVLVWSTQAVIVEHLRAGRLSQRALAQALTVLWSGVFAAAEGGTAG